MNWDEPDDPPHSAAEVVAGLRHTWQILRAYVEPSTTVDPDDPSPVSEQVRREAADDLGAERRENSSHSTRGRCVRNTSCV